MATLVDRCCVPTRGSGLDRRFACFCLFDFLIIIIQHLHSTSEFLCWGLWGLSGLWSSRGATPLYVAHPRMLVNTLHRLRLFTLSNMLGLRPGVAHPHMFWWPRRDLVTPTWSGPAWLDLMWWSSTWCRRNLACVDSWGWAAGPSRGKLLTWVELTFAIYFCSFFLCSVI